MSELSKIDIKAIKSSRDMILAYHPQDSEIKTWTGNDAESNLVLRCIIEEKTNFSNRITSYYHIPLPNKTSLKNKFPLGFKIHLSAPDPLKFLIKKWEDFHFEIWDNNSSDIISKANLMNEQIYLITKNHRILIHSCIKTKDSLVSKF